MEARATAVSGAPGGARRRVQERVRPAYIASWAALALVVVAAACSRSDREAVPAERVDGSRVQPVPVDLEGVAGPTLLTAVAVFAAHALRQASARRSAAKPSRPSRRRAVVVRTGVDAASVTFRDVGVGLWACIERPGPREERRRWCGLAHCTLHSGRLQDPRLDIGSVTRNGATIATGWVEPGHGTTYVVVAQDGYAEVYEVAAGLPIRIGSTRGADVARSRARFEISEHAADGSSLREYPLEAAVAD